jgi:Arc/MetJ family transcription regulator
MIQQQAFVKIMLRALVNMCRELLDRRLKYEFTKKDCVQFKEEQQHLGCSVW